MKSLWGEIGKKKKEFTVSWRKKLKSDNRNKTDL